MVESGEDIIATENGQNMFENFRITRPASKELLRKYISIFLDVLIPDVNICPEHSSPMDYLWHSFNNDFAVNSINGDCIVWANRGGGKTELAAIATLLDCVFKSSCQIRILGGSGEQSRRVYEYFVRFATRGYEGFLADGIEMEKAVFTNGAAVEIMTQSSRSVRGQHINKLRCDEVELFSEDVFNAAKFIMQSGDGVYAAMELVSTMHRPYGIMQKQIAQAEKFSTPIFKWCLWEVIERCRDRECSRCPLYSDCVGKAKRACGYLSIDDSISQMRRSSRAGWESEMLCRMPNLENAVFAEFNPDIHVGEIRFDPNLPLYRTIDFGFINPFVCLWIQVDGDGVVRVIDEYVCSRATVAVHGAFLLSHTPLPQSQVAGTFCDPAGAGSNDVTGTSAVKELRRMGINVRYRKSAIQEGIELIRRALRNGDGKSNLLISNKCRLLIEAMRCYHYPEINCGPQSELPLKDGVYDHYIDALRYFFVNYYRPNTVKVRMY
ncbi:MAG: hypothetical protein PHF37_04070 [Phycisphaerae bacterium]|nr:hypothetical protein [Phycisphaerae bacterium]